MSQKPFINPFSPKPQRSTMLQVAVLLFAAAVLRYIIMISKYQSIIANHVEVSTPLSSWKRVLEGTFLFSRGINPYEGDLLHETPLAIQFYNVMLDYVFKNVYFMFIAFDLGSGLLLYLSMRKYSKKFEEEHRDKSAFSEDVIETLPGMDYPVKVPIYVLMMILFNPYTLLGCVGCSTMGIHNFFLSLFIFGMLFNSIIVSSLALAVCASVSLYPVILIFPLTTYFVKIHCSVFKALLVVLSFLSFLFMITYYNSMFGRDFSFIRNVYGCILTVPDLQPNIGLFWYFFTEMFDHFRELFIYSFQINATILYLMPLTLTFRNRPFILTIALLFLISIFKSYPCLSDLGFVLSFIPTFIYLYSYCQQSFVISVILLMTSCLAPVLWHLWIYCASANANFFFGVTLAYAISQIFLVTDVLFAHIKWEFYLKHGKNTEINGEKGLLSLE
ncbi:phosphatidylinositol glycan anchor biosynthesis class U protein [Euwallacea similis]|uniref:phosphatidylinositol glycan anchor biosynthesis class U protein n=1 Tax=Euwallacea similis TaxID=1736056 RepID=UPI00344D2550